MANKEAWLLPIGVAVVGAIGGFGSWTLAFWLGRPPALGWTAAVPAALLLGGIASFLGVFLFARTDMRHVTHCLALAVACGLFFQPVLEGARLFVDRVVEERRVEEAKAAAVEFKERATRVHAR
jgi:hypothetical protein